MPYQLYSVASLIRSMQQRKLQNIARNLRKIYSFYILINVYVYKHIFRFRAFLMLFSVDAYLCRLNITIKFKTVPLWRAFNCTQPHKKTVINISLVVVATNPSLPNSKVTSNLSPNRFIPRVVL